MAAVKTEDIEALANVTEFTSVLVWFHACIGLPLAHTYNITRPVSVIVVMRETKFMGTAKLDPQSIVSTWSQLEGRNLITHKPQMTKWSQKHNGRKPTSGPLD